MLEEKINNLTPQTPDLEIDPEKQSGLKTDINNMFSEVETKRKALNTKQFIDDNKLRNLKVELLKKFYDSLQKMGVDPNDQESISKFLSDLEQRDPDLVQLLEEAINVLDPDSSGQVGGEQPPTGEEGGLTDQFSGLRNQVLRQ